MIPLSIDDTRFEFYDIESLENVFTLCSYNNDTHRIKVFFLVDDPLSIEKALNLAINRKDLSGNNLETAIIREIVRANPAWVAQTRGAEAYRKLRKLDPKVARPSMEKLADELIDYVEVHDLSTKDGALALARLMGVSDSHNVHDDNIERSSFANLGNDVRPQRDLDDDWDPRLSNKDSTNYVVAGYNSTNYDMTMAAYFFDSAFKLNRPTKEQRKTGRTVETRTFVGVSAKTMREFNDLLFTQYKNQMPTALRDNSDGWNAHANRIHRAWIMSGSHLDIANLNEKQSRVALKRQLGGLGRQIKESRKLSSYNARIESFQDFCELIGYNVSDVVGLDPLANNYAYAGGFKNKSQILVDYPELIYKERDGGPNQSPTEVRTGRLNADSTSAKFIANVLAPYSKMKDDEVVDFHYPRRYDAKTGKRPPANDNRRDVLEENNDFFREHIKDEKWLEAWSHVYNYYAWFRGKNFNGSSKYQEDYPSKETDAKNINHRGERPSPNTESLELEPKFEGHGLNRKNADPKAPAVIEAIKDPEDVENTEDPQKVSERRTLRNKSDAPSRPTTIPFPRDAEGHWSRAYANFSIGGIHGAEVDVDRVNRDNQERLRQAETITKAIETLKGIWGEGPEGAMAMRKAASRNGKGLTSLVPDAVIDENGSPSPAGRPWTNPLTSSTMSHKDVLSRGFTIKNGGSWRESVEPDLIELFKTREGEVIDENTGEKTQRVVSNKVNSDYTTTSVGWAVHEDFSSYYPSLLTNMHAYENPSLGEDRYAGFYKAKEELGKQLKNDTSLTPSERALLQVRRNGYKLLLNAASGASAAVFENSIRLDNMILAMRCIGQLFSMRIGVAQALGLEDCTIASINTDGLFTIPKGDDELGLDVEGNNRVLKEASESINILIEPETVLLVSKDANNRLELQPDDNDPTGFRIDAAGGGQLACWDGPNPEKSLAHPAMVDRMLAFYLRRIAIDSQDRDKPEEDKLSIYDPLDRGVVREMLEAEMRSPDTTKTLRLLGNILAASPSSITYPFALDPVLTPEDTKIGKPDVISRIKDAHPHAIQHYNRVFIVRPGTEGAVNILLAGAWKASAVKISKRVASGAVKHVDEPKVALPILKDNGVSRCSNDHSEGYEILAEDQDTQLRAVTGMEPHWPLLINNDDLYELPERVRKTLLASIDLEAYIDLVEDAYSSWRNKR